MSCVDDAVSPQVEAIREQQVEWMKAKTVFELAEAEFKNAETALKVALTANQTALTAGILEANAFDKASNVWTLKTKELLYTTAVADNAADVKEAEERLAKADVNLKKALNELQLAVAASKDDQAQLYYTNYAAEATKLSGLYTQRLTFQKNIADNNLLLSTDEGALKNFLKLTQLDIDSDKVLLATQKESLASLKAVIADPTLIEKEINNLEAANNVLTASQDKLNVDLKKATNDETVALKVYNDGVAIITKMVGYKTALNTVELAIASNDKTVIEKQKDLSDALSDLVAKKLVLTNAQEVYTEKKAFFDARVAIYESAKAAVASALEVLELKTAAQVSAQLKYNEDNSVANKTVLDNAKIAKIDANTAYVTANGKLTTATTNMNAAAGPFKQDVSPLPLNALKALSNAETAVNTAQSAVTTADANLLTAKNTKSTSAAEKARLDSQIAALTTSFNTESAQRFANYENYLAKGVAVSDLTKQIGNITITFNQNIIVITQLKTSKTNINSLKTAENTLAKAIIGTEKSIADNTNSLSISNSSNAIAETKAKVAKYTEDLKTLELQIDAVGKLAKYWKDLLGTIFTL